mgnify:CR=1 FL=1
MSSTRNEASASAEYHFTESAVRRVAAIHDTRNRAYTESWLRDFTVEFQARGGDVVYASSCATGRITRLMVADVAGHGHTVAATAADLRRFYSF